jgi:putative Ca2+/H+ antiporter (TMEM165/GDT1 family)
VNLAIAATVFGLVAVAELPDKTMIASIVLGSRGRPVPVWIGGTIAFGLHVALAVVAGRFLQLLPHRTLEIVTTTAFGLGALYLLFIPERSEVAKGEEEAERASQAETKTWRIAAGAFGVIAVGEFGDLTQLLLVNLEARYKSPVSVFVGGFLALAAVGAIGAFSGRALVRVVPLSVIRRVGGLALVGFTAYGISTLVS